MSPVKQEVMRILESLPDDCSYEDVQYRIYLRETVDRGIRDIDAGRVVSQEEMERRVEQWLK